MATDLPERIWWVCPAHGRRYVSTIIAWEGGSPSGAAATCDVCQHNCHWERWDG